MGVEWEEWGVKSVGVEAWLFRCASQSEWNHFEV